MQKTFINVPKEIEQEISSILSESDKQTLTKSIEKIHNGYLNRDKGQNKVFLHTLEDAHAYLALRFPATYAQITASLLAINEVIPSFSPKSVLDIGSGPGTGIFAAYSIWPELEKAVGIDSNTDLLKIGNTIKEKVNLPININWQEKYIRNDLELTESADLVIISNVLNEVTNSAAERLIDEAYKACNGILLIIEPGTEYGNEIIKKAAVKFSETDKIIAPFINHKFVKSSDTWIHFPQRFIRPEFLRRARQQMRESILMASDWEETKYSYLAISKQPLKGRGWGRTIGNIKKQKGFLEVPVLTEDKIQTMKILKRYKKQFTFAKDLKWGQIILHKEDLIVNDK